MSGNAQTITYDVYTYAIEETTVDGEAGRYYTMVIKTNIPVADLKLNDADVPEEDIVSDYEFKVTLDALKITTVPEIKLTNKYKTSDTGTTITLTPSEKSNVKTRAKALGGLYVNDQFKASESALTGITVVEPKLEVSAEGVKLPTLNSNLIESKKLFWWGDQPTISKVNDTDVIKVKLPLDEISEITVNGKKGKWIVMYMAVSSNNIKDENNNAENGIIIDTSNISSLLTETKLDNDYLVPVWIDLENSAVVAATSKAGTTSSTPVTIKFSHSNPVLETNSIDVVFENITSNKTVDLSDIEEPTAGNVNTSTNATVEEKQVEYQKWLGDAQSTGEEIKPTDAQAIDHNSTLIENIDAQTYGNTVVVTVKGNWSDLQEVSENQAKIIPLELDVTALKITSKDDKVYIKAANNNWGLMKYDQDYNKTILYLGCSYDANTPYKDFYVTKSSSTLTSEGVDSLKTPYIHYIIEFVNAD